MEEPFGKDFELERIERRGAKPKLQPDETTLRRVRELGALQCTMAEAAGVLLCGCDAFRDFLRRWKEAEQAWLEGKESGKASLRRMQFIQAKKSAAMAIWLGKQYLGQKDNLDINRSVDSGPVGSENGAAEGVSALLARARLENTKAK
jgi:hypothetical protein